MQHEENRKSIVEMLAEFLRELAVLILVFYPIEDRLHVLGDTKHIIFTSALLLCFGVALEKFR